MQHGQALACRDESGLGRLGDAVDHQDVGDGGVYRAGVGKDDGGGRRGANLSRREQGYRGADIGEFGTNRRIGCVIRQGALWDHTSAG